MPRSRRLFRIVATIAAGALVLEPVSPALAQTSGSATSGSATSGSATASATATAQSGPTSAAPTSEGAAPGQVAEPPTRVARLAAISGTVSFHTAGEDHWDPAVLNTPITDGGSLWTEPGATASIEVSDSRIDLASTTEFDIDQLDPHALTATQAQGEVFLNLQDLLPGDSYTIRTPRGSVAMSQAGQYEVQAGDTQNPTTVTVVTGAAQISGDALSIAVQPGQTATLVGTGTEIDPFRSSTAAMVRDQFLQAELQGQAEPPRQQGTSTEATVMASATACPPVVRRMPGGQQLGSYGTWSSSPKYGTVWRPRVASDWVPYRDGHWAWIEPWGWTWIDDEPWGYAPFHYGRWIQDDGWAWAPTYYEPGYVVPDIYAAPVYAPALVSFFGVGAAIGVGIGFGWGHWGWRSVGWAPLGWGEPYRPWFRGGPRYFNAVNRLNVGNINTFVYNNSDHHVTINDFANGGRGATVVPTSAMANSQRIADQVQAVSRQDLADAHPVAGAPTPTAHTLGMTRGIAQRLGLPDAAEVARTPAPGPAVRSFAHGNVPLARPTGEVPAARGEARPTGAPAGGAARPETPAPHAEAAVARRGAGLPALRDPRAFTRAFGGAPGPAIVPRDRNGPESVAESQATHGAPGHPAPGPALTPHGGAAHGLGEHGNLPALRTPAGLAARTPGIAGSVRGPAAEPRSFVAPQQRSAAGPSGAPRRNYVPPEHYPEQRSQPIARGPQFDQTRQQPRFESQRYQAAQTRPQYRYAPPRYDAPRYDAPRYDAPRYGAPRLAPAGQTGGGGRRPYLP